MLNIYKNKEQKQFKRKEEKKHTQQMRWINERRKYRTQTCLNEERTIKRYSNQFCDMDWLILCAPSLQSYHIMHKHKIIYQNINNDNKQKKKKKSTFLFHSVVDLFESKNEVNDKKINSKPNAFKNIEYKWNMPVELLNINKVKRKNRYETNEEINELNLCITHIFGLQSMTNLLFCLSKPWCVLV